MNNKNCKFFNIFPFSPNHAAHPDHLFLIIFPHSTNIKGIIIKRNQPLCHDMNDERRSPNSRE
jgi:hypothetical protein